MSIFGVSVADTYNVATKPISYEETFHIFLCDLAEDVINDDLNSRPTRSP